jgi:hypothetical protein
MAARDWTAMPMIYRNTEMRLDQLVSYFSEDKIDLSPVFQRGNVWSLPQRQRLLENIVQGRPIPAIFLYKQATGSKYTYNILDGKQRLESLILFIAGKRPDFSIDTWKDYFSSPKLRKLAGFSIQLPASRPNISTLTEAQIRELREYAIPTVEISMDDESLLDEIINLFVDINQYGVKVKRFEIVQAMHQGKGLLKSVFDMIATRQKRHADVFYKSKSTSVTRVLKSLRVVQAIQDKRSQVDRMWQQVLEIVLFFQTQRHRKPVDILKSIIAASKDQSERFPALSKKDEGGVRAVFNYLDTAYKSSELRTTSLATDQTMFYTMITALIASDLLTTVAPAELTVKIVAFGKIIDSRAPVPAAKKLDVDKFRELVRNRTQDTPLREERQRIFIDVVRSL